MSAVAQPPPPHAGALHALGTITEVASTASSIDDIDDNPRVDDFGLPTSGMYARNGIWDDDSDAEDADGSPSGSGSGSFGPAAGGPGGGGAGGRDGGKTWRQRLSSTSSTAGDRRSLRSSKSLRSRSGTLSGPQDGGPWPWTRKATTAYPTAAAAVAPPTASAGTLGLATVYGAAAASGTSPASTSAPLPLLEASPQSVVRHTRTSSLVSSIFSSPAAPDAPALVSTERLPVAPTIPSNAPSATVSPHASPALGSGATLAPAAAFPGASGGGSSRSQSPLPPPQRTGSPAMMPSRPAPTPNPSQHPFRSMSPSASPMAPSLAFPGSPLPNAPVIHHNELRHSMSRMRLRSKASSKEGKNDFLSSVVNDLRAPLSPVGVNGEPPSGFPSSLAAGAAIGKGIPAAPAASSAIAQPSMRQPSDQERKEKSAWKRGVERLWRSKSASTLREPSKVRPSDMDVPPVPVLPRAQGGLGAASPAGSPAARPSAVKVIPLSGPLAMKSPTFSISPALRTAPLPVTTSSALSVPNHEYGASHSFRPSSTIPFDDSIRQQLDVRYPSFAAHSSRSTFAEEAFTADPFASAVDYVGRPPSRGGGHSPMPTDFLPPSFPPGRQADVSPRGSPSLANLKASIMPRLRKSRSMAMGSRPNSHRPNSLVGLFGADRKKTLASPSRLLSPEQASTIDELVLASVYGGGSDPLDPPRPLFYDNFDLSTDDDSDEKEGGGGATDKESPTSFSTSVLDKRHASLHSSVDDALDGSPVEFPAPASVSARSPRAAVDPAEICDAYDAGAASSANPIAIGGGDAVERLQVVAAADTRPLSPPIAEVSVPLSARGGLTITTPASTTDHSVEQVELLTPAAMSAPAHVTTYTEYYSPTIKHTTSQHHTRTSSLPLESPSFHDLYQQLGMWPLETSTSMTGGGGGDEKDEDGGGGGSIESPPEMGSDRGGRLVVANPDLATSSSERNSLASTASPTTTSSSTHNHTNHFKRARNWDAVANVFPTIDDSPFLSPATSLDYAYNTCVDYAGAVSVADLNAVLGGLDFDVPYPYRTRRGSLGSIHSASVAVLTDSTTHSIYDSPNGNRTSAVVGRSNAAPDSDNSACWTSWRDVPRRRTGSASREGSRGPSPDYRRRMAPTESGWLEVDSESSDEELDDTPLYNLHPAAAAAQQQRLAEAVRTREARRAERERDLRSTKRDVVAREQRNTASRSASVRDPQHHHRERGHRSREWNGEGAVPADMLAGRLERVAVSPSSRPSHSVQSPTAHGFPQQQQHQQSSLSRVPTTAPLNVQRAPSGPLSRPPRLNRPSQGREDLVSPAYASTSSATHSAPMSRTSTSNAGASAAGSMHRPDSNTDHYGASGSRPDSRTQQYGAVSDSQQQRERVDSMGAPDRHSSRSTSGPTQPLPLPVRGPSLRRPRTLSNPREPLQPPPDVPALPSPVPHRTPAALARCIVMAEGYGKLMPVEVFPDTTARDVLVRARERGDIGDFMTGPTTGWVVYEQYAELGLERQLREYENIASVMRGWDPRAKGNLFIIRESHQASATWARAISDNAPFVGGWVQLETKRGKWSKRWLEVRGGQIFLSKNEKGKDEMQVNTLFSDTFVPVSGYAAPRQFVFAFKRLEAASTFENPSEHIHYLCADDTTGWKLSTAAFASRSYTMAASNETIKRGAAPPRAPPAASPVSSQSRSAASGLSRGPSMARPGTHGAHSAGVSGNGTTLLARAATSAANAQAASAAAQAHARATGTGLINLNGNSAFTGHGLLARK